jgi:TonB family protein
MSVPCWLAMRMFYFALIGVMLLIRGSAAPPARKLQAPFPDQFLIGRHTFVDFGPPFDHYEVFSVRSEGKGTLVERITVTPPGNACLQPATIQIATRALEESLSDLLGQTDPCTIPEKDLRREIKRCRKCLVFSGADVVMQVQCGGQSRQIRMDILDRDMFDPQPRTPKRTSWTMALLGRLNRALGPSVMEQPIFSVSEPAEPPVPGARANFLLEDLGRGRFDTLFQKAPHRPSELFRQAQTRPPAPSVELLKSTPFSPLSYGVPKYPPIARLARIQGQVSFTTMINSNGSPSTLKFHAGHVMLQQAVESAAAGWRFGSEAVDQEVTAVIEFKTNCPSVQQ